MRGLLLATAWLCLLSPPGFASPRPAGYPVELVKVATTQIATIARAATERAAMTEQIESVMAGLVDFEGFSARTLGKGWESLSAAQRQRFVGAFRGLVMGTYARRFKPGATFRVSYRGETAYSDAPAATVKTTIHGDRAAADVDYVFAPAQVDEGVVWRAVDISVDEVSMARNWRGQFKRILERDGFDVLIAKIEKKGRKR
jgi:phospholipid transport system substrate-binding protein